ADNPKHYNSRTFEKQKETSMTHIFKRQFPIMPIRRQENPDISFKSGLDYVNNVLHNNKDKDDNNMDEESTEDKDDKDKEDSSNEANDNNIDVRYIVFPRVNGRMRLILGMTFANNPMKIMSYFKNVIDIAYTTWSLSLHILTIL